MSPDRKTLKDNIKNIKRKDINYDKFDNIIFRSNDIYFICSHFYHAYLLYLFKKNEDFPIIDSNFFRTCFKTISKKSCGPKPKGSNLQLLKKLELFFDTEFVFILANKNKKDKILNTDDYKFNATNLSYIINVYQEEMEINVRNNITLNFFKYVHQFVNQTFIKNKIKVIKKEELKKLSKYEQIKYNNKKKEEYDKINKLKKELYFVKNDLCDNNEIFTSESKYHKWIKDNKNIIFPNLDNKYITYYEDIKINCCKYLKHMILMNKLLEYNKKKLFSSIPLRTEIVNKYVTINSSALKDIFGEVNSGLTNNELWDKYFNISNKKYKLKNYSFNFQISTDGFATSINFIKNNKIEEKRKKSELMAKASKETKKNRKTKTSNEIEELVKQKKEENKENTIKRNEEIKKYKELKSKEFKELSKEKQEEIKLKIKLQSDKYEYIEDAVKNKILKSRLEKDFNLGKIKVVDPGYRSPMTILGKGKVTKMGKKRGDKILFSYTSGARINATKRIKYSQLIENKKRKININGKTLKEYETEISSYNSKTTKLDKFLEYFKKKYKLRRKVSSKMEIDEGEINIGKLKKEIVIEYKNGIINDNKINKVLEKYKKVEELKEGIEYNKYLRKLKWFSYINKQRHESELLNEIEKIYGKEAIFAFGNWSKTKGIKRISMPNMGMKKLLSKRFNVYLIDEFNTSKLCWKTKTEGNKLKVINKYIKDNKEIKSERLIHSLLTFKMGNKEEGIINRDLNATKNMYNIVESLVKIGKRPVEFSRKKEDPQKNKKDVTIKEKYIKGANLHIGYIKKELKTLN